jgi:hypothetical protein
MVPSASVSAAPSSAPSASGAASHPAASGSHRGWHDLVPGGPSASAASPVATDWSFYKKPAPSAAPAGSDGNPYTAPPL